MRVILMFVLAVLCGMLWSAWTRTRYKKNGF